jgi:dTDP-4-dehydrorhamnose reductase
VRRPAYSVLDKSRIQAALGLEIPAWQDGLRRCLASLA